MVIKQTKSYTRQNKGKPKSGETGVSVCVGKPGQVYNSGDIIKLQMKKKSRKGKQNHAQDHNVKKKNAKKQNR